MNKLLTSALAVFTGLAAYSMIACAPQVYAQGSSGCVNPTDMSVYETKITRGTGTLAVRGGKPLCAAQDIVFQSFNVPTTWDKKGWNKTAIPQTKFAATQFTIPAGVANFTKTVTVATPDDCYHTQLDFYLAPGYDTITTLTGDDERNIAGVLFAATEKCKEEEKTLKVCYLKNFTIITIKESEFDSTKHSKDITNCKKPVEMCPIEGKEDLPKDDEACVETPVVPEPVTPEVPPAELPHTGFASAFAPIAGIGSLTASGYYYLVSRRSRI